MTKPDMQIGQTWRNRRGDLVKLEKQIQEGPYLFQDDNARTYTSQGKFNIRLGGQPHRLDLAELISCSGTRVDTLEGGLLDFAVAMAIAHPVVILFDECIAGHAGANGEGVYRAWRPSKNWEIAGPLLVRHRISLEVGDGGTWIGSARNDKREAAPLVWEVAADPLVAAMRALVVFRLGPVVDLGPYTPQKETV